MKRITLIALLALLFGAGCIPDKLCETVEKDNRCDSNADCVVAFCAADCDNCRVVVSRKQADRAYCLIVEGEDVPDRCREAYEDLNCSSVPPICPPPGNPVCDGGKCIPVVE